MTDAIKVRERALEVFEYRDGGLYWKVQKSPRNKVGSRAGTVLNTGYRQVCLDWVKWFEHRLIFLMHHGYVPDYIDHIDGDRANNRIENLRAATASQNQWNRGRDRSNTSGYKGVSFNKRVNRWYPAIVAKGKKYCLGGYSTPEEAHKAYCAAADRLHGKFANAGEATQ